MPELDRLKVVIEADSKDFEKKADAARQKIDDLRKQRVKIDLEAANTKDVNEKLKLKIDRIDVERQIRDLHNEIAGKPIEAKVEASGLEKLRNALQGIANKVSLQADTKQFDSQIEATKAKIADLEVMLSESKSLNLSSQSIIEAEAQLEKLKNQLSDLEKKEQGVSFSWKKMFQGGNAAGEMKKVAMSMLGIRGAFTAIRKATSMWLSQNQEVQDKLNGCWMALGQLMAPAVQFLINLFSALLGIINALVQSLGFAGIKMKGLGSAAGATAKKMKQLAGFDELNNLTSQDQSGGGGGGAKFEEPDWKWLETAKKYAQELAAVLLGVVAAVKAIAKGASAIQALGIGMMVAGIVYAFENLLEYLHDPSWEAFGDIITGIGVAIAGLGLVLGAAPVAIAGAIVAGLGVLIHFHDQIVGFLDNIKAAFGRMTQWIEVNWTNSGNILLSALGIVAKGIVGILDSIITFFRDAFDRIATGVRNILDGIIAMFRGDFTGGIKQVLLGIDQAVGGTLYSIYEFVRNIANNIIGVVIDLGSGIYTTLVNAIASLATAIGNTFTSIKNTIWTNIKSGLNLAIDQVNKFISFLNGKLALNFDGLSILGQQIIPPIHQQLFTIPSIPKLSTGTNKVPQDMLAVIHKGEAVVPKKYNPSVGNGQDMSETNDLLRQLITSVGDININPTVSVGDVGRAAVSYIRTQSRAMGGSIV